MKIINKFLNPFYIYYYLTAKGYLKCNDKKYLKMVYKFRTGKELNLKNPKTYNEKLQWLKLYDRKDIYTTMVDKYEAKKYVSNIIGEEYIVPTLGIYNEFDEIDFDKLPNQFVIKCTHDSGGLVIVRDKLKLNIKSAKKKINKCLKNNYYYSGREWPYKNVKPRIIIEKYLTNSDETEYHKSNNSINTPEVILKCKERWNKTGFSANFFDSKWEYLDYKKITYENGKKKTSSKRELDKMMELFKKISKYQPSVKIEFYTIENKAYFGEITFNNPSTSIDKNEINKLDVKKDGWEIFNNSENSSLVLNKENCYLCLNFDKEQGMRDYKFFCFNGEPKLMYLSEGLENHATAGISFYDMNFKLTDCKRSDYRQLDFTPKKPKTFEQMKEFSKILSKNIPHLRVDWYEIDGHLYFGELTFATCSGFVPFESEEWNKKLGDLIELPENNKYQ